jgi:hypothetical protein
VGDGIGIVQAVASSSAIAAWAVVQAHPLVWGGIIAAAQVADALKDFALGSYTITLDNPTVRGGVAPFPAMAVNAPASDARGTQIPVPPNQTNTVFGTGRTPIIQR